MLKDQKTKFDYVLRLPASQDYALTRIDPLDLPVSSQAFAPPNKRFSISSGIVALQRLLRGQMAEIRELAGYKKKSKVVPKMLKGMCTSQSRKS